ncbi:MAG: response regulator transcription factor [Chloroflexi bacterium]|nr:response regulator transcription factor [Chloroflexota bacterium]
MTHPQGARVLVVDDEPAIRRTISANLRSHQFQVATAESGREALEQFARFRPDVVLLDLVLPDLHGREVIRMVRERAATPIIVLSARGEEAEKVAALELGADDYLTKPFGVRELLVRIRVALRHAAHLASPLPLLRAGELVIDFERRHVTIADQPIRLTPTEYDLLKLLAMHPNRVLTNRQLLQQVWGSPYSAESHYLHVYTARLRKKLGPAARRLVTEPGVGYRLLTDDFTA